MGKTGGRRGTNQYAVRTPGTGLRPEQRHGPEVLARLAGGDDADAPWDVSGAVEPEGAGTRWPWPWLAVLCVLISAVALGAAIVLIVVL